MVSNIIYNMPSDKLSGTFDSKFYYLRFFANSLSDRDGAGAGTRFYVFYLTVGLFFCFVVFGKPRTDPVGPTRVMHI